MPAAASTQPTRVYQPVVDRDAHRREEIARIDALSRTRALTDAESWRLQQLIYRESYAELRRVRRAA